jgi:DNA-binding MarR family transcriptional regulator
MSGIKSEWIGLRLLVISNRYLQPVHAEIEDDYGLTRDDVAVLVHLSETGNATAQEIVRSTGRPKNSMSRSVVSLERRGIIRRHPHPVDGRAAVLQLTATGRKLQGVLAEAFGQADRHLLRALDDEEREAFILTLIKIGDYAARDE